MMSNHSRALPTDEAITARRAVSRCWGERVTVWLMLLLRRSSGRGRPAQPADQGVEIVLADLDLVQGDVLVGGVGLRDVARTADDGVDAGVGELAGLRAVGDLVRGRRPPEVEGQPVSRPVVAAV